MTETPPPDHVGQLGGLANIVKNLTLTNVLILALLAVILIPSYLLWRVVNDQSMLGRFTSSFQEISSEQVPCTLRIGSIRGGSDLYSITTGLAYSGSDRWMIGVLMDRKPNDIELQDYCETLREMVAYVRDPLAPPPTYPGSDEPLVWRYSE